MQISYDPHSAEIYFNRGVIYGCNDDILRFAFFCKAALSYILITNNHPDIIHCHDWPTGLVPVLLRDLFAQQGLTLPKVCYTIHNFRHQGNADIDVLHATGLNRPDYYFQPDKLLDSTGSYTLNLMKGGIVYADYVTTVSPHHAWEAQYSEQGFGLGPVLAQYHEKFEGILNGVDYDTWSPETDAFIPVQYTASTIQNKYRNKDALRDRLRLQDVYKPVVCSIGRLDAQKGIDLIKHACTYALTHGAQFVLLGTSPDPQIAEQFEELKLLYAKNPDCHIVLRFDEELAHVIYAGSDLIVVPSIYEPCGLTQIIALKYGTVPIVRSVGGLVNTVFDIDYSDLPVEKRNGFCFRDTDETAIDSALSRAIRLAR